MMIAARSPGSKSASSSARARGSAISLKSEYVRRTFSRSRSASIRQTSEEKRSSASLSAAPRQVYWRRSSIRKLLIVDCRLLIGQAGGASTATFPGNQQSKINNQQCLQSRLNLSGQRAEVGHALQFIIRQLDMEVIFQLGQQVERLQAVNAQRFKEVAVGSEFFARHFEMCGGEGKNFVQRLLSGLHRHFILIQSGLI